MANLTPWLSTLRCIVPVASSGQILSQYVLVLASMQTPCSHLLRVTHECIVCSLRSSFLNVGMQLICLKDLESEAPVLNSEFCIRGLEGRLTFFFGHLLAEIFGAISLCSFWKGRLKENHLSAVTGRGVDRMYISQLCEKALHFCRSEFALSCEVEIWWFLKIASKSLKIKNPVFLKKNRFFLLGLQFLGFS